MFMKNNLVEIANALFAIDWNRHFSDQLTPGFKAVSFHYSGCRQPFVSVPVRRAFGSELSGISVCRIDMVHEDRQASQKLT
jgi:hypothetical protein